MRPFFIVVRDAIASVPATQLPSTHRCALLCIASFADQDGHNAYPSVQTIADCIGKTRPKTVYILKELVDAGWLQREQRKTEKGAQTSTEYVINLDGAAVEKKRRGGYVFP